MNIVKCDICKKTIKSTGESVLIRIGGFFGKPSEICQNCAKPIVKFMENKKLIKKEKKANKKA